MLDVLETAAPKLISEAWLGQQTLEGFQIMQISLSTCGNNTCSVAPVFQLYLPGRAGATEVLAGVCDVP